MKKILLAIILFCCSVHAIEVQLDLNTNTGNEPLDVNLNANILQGIQSRECTDKNECGTTNNKPEILQACGTCTDGDTLNCSTSEGCPGIQTCNSGTWGFCVDIPDSCPATQATITINQLLPFQNINVVQNQLFTFQTSVKCNDFDCGNIQAVLDPTETISIDSGGKDTYLAENEQHYGTSDGLSLINENSRILMKFDVSSIPTGTIITEAFLEIRTTSAWRGGDPISIHQIHKEWGETTSGWNSAGGANAYYAEYNTSAWDAINMNAGTDYESAYETIFIPDNNSTANTYLVEITNLIQNWVNNSADNHGLMMKYYNYDGMGNIRFYSKEASSSNQRPKLIITYSEFLPKGVIPMNSGNPFYTTDLNPQTCSNMLAGETCINTWHVMPTGNIGDKYEFFVDYIPENTAIPSKQTTKIEITIDSSENCSDLDSDGFNGFHPTDCSSGTDCDDLNPSINPNAEEVCGNSLDDNCNKQIDEDCFCSEDWVCGDWSECSSGIPPYVFEWDFDGDGTIDTTTNSPKNWMTYTYNAGKHNPKIRITDVLNNTAQDSKEINVSLSGNFLPKAEANGPYTAVKGENITLNSTGSTDEGMIVEYKWKIINVKGTPCIQQTLIQENPVITCSQAGTASATLTVKDNYGAENSDSAEIKINQIQIKDLINIAKLSVNPEIIKQEENLEITARIENATNEVQDFNIYFEIKENVPDSNINEQPNLIPGLELVNQQILPYSQGEGRKDFVLVVSSADLQTNLEGQKNYWVYATAKAQGEINTSMNTRRTTFNYNEQAMQQIKVPETNFINILILLIAITIILNKKEGEQK